MASMKAEQAVNLRGKEEEEDPVGPIYEIRIENDGDITFIL